jgi:hypothetical protein
MWVQLAKRGHTLESWAAQIRARARAVLDRNRRARRTRALEIAGAGAADLATAAGVNGVRRK